MARIGKSLTELATEIERRANAKRDFIAPAGKLSLEVVEDKPVLALSNGTIQTFGVQDLAHGQIAEYTGIPAAYYKRMVAEDPRLLATNVNRWLHEAKKNPERRMVRTLDHMARAFLSDRYRPLENEDLAEAVLPVLLDMDLLFLSCEITERRLYIKCVDQRITLDVPTGKHMGDGGHTIFDTVSPSITISNSEVGSGALSIQSGVFTRACTNLALFGDTAMRKYHTGARASVSDDVYALLTDDTKKATDRAVWMQVRDLVRSAFDAAAFDARTKKLAVAAGDPIPAENVIEVVERVGRRLTLNEGERKGVLARLIEAGDLTRYGLHAAVTRHSADVSIDYDRATELERLGGDVIELAPSEWREIIERPTKKIALAA